MKYSKCVKTIVNTLKQKIDKICDTSINPSVNCN